MKSSSRPNIRQPWTAAELDRIRALAAEHKSIREIARLLGRTATAVQNKAIQEGIATTRAKPTKYTIGQKR
jgi:IS30 family transposase